MFINGGILYFVYALQSDQLYNSCIEVGVVEYSHGVIPFSSVGRVKEL